MLAALGYWGFTAVRGWPRIVLGLAVPILAAVVWGMFLAPKAARPLTGPGKFWLEVAIFGLAVAALAAAGRPRLAAGFALAVALNMLMLHFWRQ